MTKLLDAMQTNDTFTKNGMPTNSTTLNHCVDLFFHIGVMRSNEKQYKINAFVKAFSEDPLTAMKILFWVRDIRGGAGERQTFRDIMGYLAEKQVKILKKNMVLISEYGRWDDLLIFIGTKVEKTALGLIAGALKAENGLASKWLPRPCVKGSIKKMQVNVLRKYLGLSPKEYRQLLVSLSNTVEQAMCSGDWTNIDYSHVPSKAMSGYMKSFRKHDEDGFSKYMESLEKGETKINAGAVYPYDIIKSLKEGNVDGADAQWNALPNYLVNNSERVLPVVDTSGSMNCLAGKDMSVTCMDVAVSLGLYISERNIGPFKDAFITFSELPKLQVLKGSLSDRFNQLSRCGWGYNTNLQKVFEVLLKKAKAGNVSEDEMPTIVMVLSDMQFDCGTNNSWGDNAQAMVEREYSEAGYKVPKIVYWSLQSTNSDSPVQAHKSGAACVSGFSGSLLTNILSGGVITPFTIMMDVVNSERYSKVQI